MTLMFMYSRIALAVAAAATLAFTAACGGPGTAGASGGRVDVVAAFYPLQYVAEQVGGDRVHVTNLVPPGAEPHDLELSPRQVASLGDAGLVVYLSGFQPAVDAAVGSEARGHALDAAATGTQLAGEGGKDPHIWLDPTRLAAVADAVATRLGKVDPAHAARFTANAAALRGKLTALDGEFRTGLTRCASRDIVTSHAAFGYLAARYGLHQIGITGLTPDQEPTAARLAEVARLARDRHVRVVFFETLVSPKIAETLAREVGARAEVLDPIEGLEPGSSGDYLSVMRADLATLRSALGCS
ncbi:MAG TPA: metal ABC transporter substrate-binding protein [Mycobacteriales bacterium]